LQSKVQEKVAGKLAEKAADRSDQADEKREVRGKSADKSEDQTHQADGTGTRVAGAPQHGTASHQDKDKKKDEDITGAERRRLRRLISSAEGASAPR